MMNQCMAMPKAATPTTPKMKATAKGSPKMV
jgi:hypothetical protein